MSQVSCSPGQHWYNYTWNCNW